MTVAQYAVKFNRLDKFCLKLIDTETNKTKQFVQGLCPKLKKTLAPFTSRTFASTVRATSRVENNDRQLRIALVIPITHQKGLLRNKEISEVQRRHVLPREI